MAYSTSALSTSKGAADTVSVNDWNVGLADNLHTGVMRAIGEASTTGTVASIDLTSLSAAYRHLMVRAYIRQATTSSNEFNTWLRLNNDAGNNYSYVGIYAYMNGANPTISPVGLSTSKIYIGNTPTCGASSGLYGIVTLDLPDYLSTEGQKLVGWKSELFASTSSASIATRWGMGYWASAVAINRVTVLPDSGNLSSGCRLTVYGLPWTSTS